MGLVAFSAARDELFRRLSAVFASADFAAYKVAAPTVFKGNPATEPPCYVAVDEIASSVRAESSASMGHAGIGFNVNVFCFAQDVDLVRAADTLNAYVDCVFSAVLADQTLAMTVDWAMPEMVTEGTAKDPNRRYMAAAQIAVACKVESACPAWVRAIV